ncbi:hypothetical protein PENTCL1PPCAC_26638, partial [Pristionchus entomophagus]
MEIDVSSDRLTAVVGEDQRSPNSLSPDPHGFSMTRKKSMKERMQEIEEKRSRKKGKGKKKENEGMSIFDAAMLIKNINPQRIDLISANIQNEFGVCGWILTILSYILIFFTLPISACMCIKVVQEYERAVIFRLGRLMPGGAKGPGIFFIVPCIDTYRKVDLRVLSFEVPPQEILSKDSVTVAVDAVVYFRISNATISVTNVEDAARSTKLLAQTTLRNILGTKTLAEMLSDREAISHQMQSTLDEATEPWGVKVERVEVKDVRLPVQLQRAMAAEAEAAREARAKVIVAEGEQKASRALKEAAEVIAESPSALQLRYLQTLNSISAEKNSTIIFPFPIDLLSAFLQRSSPKTTFHSRTTAPVQQQGPCELRQRLGSDSSSTQTAPTAPSTSQQHTTTYSSSTSTWRPRPSPLTGLSDTTTTVVRRGLGEVAIDIERNPSGEEEPPPLPKKIRSCCLYKYPDWVQGMVGEGRPPTSGGHGHSHGGSMGPPPQASSMNTTTTTLSLSLPLLLLSSIVAPPLLSSSLRNPSMCWRIKNTKYLTEDIPLCKDEAECMREAAYQSSAYSMPVPSQPPSQLDPGSLYDWRRSGVTSSSTAASTAAPAANAAGGGAKRPSVAGGANGNTLLKQAIANRMIKEPKEGGKEEMKEGTEGKETKEKETDEMSTSLVMSAAWYRDDEGKTGFKNREWEKAKKIQKSAVKEKEKNMEESGSTVDEIDEELLKKEGDSVSIQSGESTKSKKEAKEEKKEKERLEKEKKKLEKEEKKKEKERMKAEEKEKKEEEKKEKERRKRSESPKGSKIEKAEKEKEKRESKEKDEDEEEKKKGRNEEKKEERKRERSAKPPKDPTKLKKTRSEESSTSSRTLKVSDSPRSTTIGERRDSSMSESSRVSAISHKSVKFNDRIQVNEIERNDEDESSSDDDFALMSDVEMKRLRDAAAARQAPPTSDH